VFTLDQSTTIELVLVHLAERRRIRVNAHGRREGGIADVVRGFGTEGALTTLLPLSKKPINLALNGCRI
jgi:hypothetical protein